ncbi:MAG: radical SAM protein, partial [Deltaproteobacteria bacterium]
MKILLISANSERSPYPVFPIGLAYLAGPLVNAGHELSVLDLCFETLADEALQSRIAGFSPRLAVISLRNIDNVTWPASRSYLENVRSIVSACPPHVSTVVGGSGFSLMPQKILDFLEADFGIVGEGEEILPLLIERLERNEEITGLPGVLQPGRHGYASPLPVEHIGTPDRSIFNVARYQREGGMANVQTKRGCPFNCIYCTYPLLEGRTMRLRPVSEVIAELKQLVDDGVSYIYFVDDIFNFPMSYAEELCRAIIAEKLPLNWSAFINPAHFSPELLDYMLEAGCDAVEFGTEAGSPVMLKNLGKSFGVDEVRKASLLCRQRGVDFAHYILFGGPGESRETVLETIAMMDDLEPTA